MKRYNFGIQRSGNKWLSVAYAFIGWNVVTYGIYKLVTKGKPKEWQDLSLSK